MLPMTADDGILEELVGALDGFLLTGGQDVDPALYGAAKRQRGVLDFTDLEQHALRALALPEVQRALRAQYRYVFVDEYQDSSAI